MNDLGVIVGLANNFDGWHAVFWKDGIMAEVTPQPSTAAFGINNSNQIVGGDSTSLSQQAFLWENNIIQYLGISGRAVQINNYSQVIGDSKGAARHAFLWDNGTIIDLGVLDGTNHSVARGINDLGIVVGTSYNASYLAFMWKNNQMINLNDLIDVNSGWILRDAYDINNLGQIVGRGEIGGENHAFLLTPIPESSITVISPNGGEELHAGYTHEITWSSEGVIENVKIEYSTNNGTNWIEIVASTENYGYYDWGVPCEISSDCLVRISHLNSDASDVSDAVFAISCQLPPDIDTILEFFDESVADGTLEGNVPGRSGKKRLKVFRNMIVKTAHLIDCGKMKRGCKKLYWLYNRCDGLPKPKDFVAGPAAPELADMIEDFMYELECE